MKKYIKYYVPILSILATSNLFAVDVYKSDDGKDTVGITGEVKVALINNQFNDTISVEDKTSKFGFYGSREISDDLTIGIQTEWAFNSAAGQTKNLFANRLGNAYLDTNVGKFTMGRQWSITYDSVQALTDIYPYTGGDGLNNYAGEDGAFNGAGRADRAIAYRFENEAHKTGEGVGIMAGIQYQGDSLDEDYIGTGGSYGQSGETNDKRKYALNFGAQITTSGFTLGIAGMTGDYVDDGSGLGNIPGGTYRASKMDVGIAYEVGSLYAAVAYSHGSNFVDLAEYQGIEALVKYAYNPAGNLIYIGYNGRDEANAGESLGDSAVKDADQLKYIEIGTTYNFNESTYAFLSFQIDVDGAKYATDNQNDSIALGIDYWFE